MNLGDAIKEEILTLHIKSPCCRSSFITGTELFAKSRKNKFTEQIARYKEKLAAKKRKAFFDEDVEIGYKIGKKDGFSTYVGKRVCPYCLSMLIRGAFLVCGRASVSTGKKAAIHIEMAVPNQVVAGELSLALAEIDIEPKTAIRRGEILLYYKKRDKIEDFVAYIGAVTKSFDMMNDDILKRANMKANALFKFDNVNIMRSVDAAVRQTKAINAIISAGDFEELPLPLRETAHIRIENPSESLDALTELHGGGVSRSTVNRRLQKIIEWARKKGYIS